MFEKKTLSQITSNDAASLYDGKDKNKESSVSFMVSVNFKEV